MSSNDKLRQKQILDILHLIQDGGDLTQAKKLFEKTLGTVDVNEIVRAEQALIADGLNPADIQDLCNVHVAIFKGNINPSKQNLAFLTPGHPVNTLKQENTVITSLINDSLLPDLKKWQQDGNNSELLEKIRHELADLLQIDKHYKRKEDSIFLIMDKYGITAPPKVMWGVDDQIRDLIKDAINAVNQSTLPDKYVIEMKIERACKEVLEMIFKEQAIMLPMVEKVATPQDWYTVKQDESEIGYTLINRPPAWKPSQMDIDEAKVIQDKTQTNAEGILDKISTNDKPLRGDEEYIAGEVGQEAELVIPDMQDAKIKMQVGALSLKEIPAIFNVLPVDLTFVDANDRVKWFSDTDRVFPRTRSVIGRPVVKCHPPKSLDKVLHILDEFHEGLADCCDFWFEMHGRFIYLEFHAVRDDNDNYLGCLEVVQDITRLRQLTGSKTLENQIDN